MSLPYEYDGQNAKVQTNSTNGYQHNGSTDHNRKRHITCNLHDNHTRTRSLSYPIRAQVAGNIISQRQQ